MTRFHFHTEDGRQHPDAEGLELEDTAAARYEAVKAVGQLVNERPEAFWRDCMFRMTVTNADGLTLFILDLSAVISPAMHL
ncbi:MAG TPA: hypothetical protein VIE16_13120 [Phenylobacterium sp.]|jgi:hypothetical protein